MNYNLLRAIKNLYFGITANIYANGQAKVSIMLVAIVKLYISSFPYGILVSKLSVYKCNKKQNVFGCLSISQKCLNVFVLENKPSGICKQMMLEMFSDVASGLNHSFNYF